MRRVRPIVMVWLLAPWLARPTSSSGQEANPAPSRVTLPLPEGIQSLRIQRPGEVIRRGPSSRAGRRGTALRGARLPALESALGDGCAARWIRVGEDAWVCSAEAGLSHDPPTTERAPRVTPVSLVPYTYVFAGYSGVPTYRRLEDVRDDVRAGELERGMGQAVVSESTLDGETWLRTQSGRWVRRRDVGEARPSTLGIVEYAPGSPSDGSHGGFTTAGLRTSATAASCFSGRADGGQSFATREPVSFLEVQTQRHRSCARTDRGWIPVRNLRQPSVPAPPQDLAQGERWVDVDRARQLLVAFEGTQPVFASLVSTGRPPSVTLPGEFHVWSKLAQTDMSNTDAYLDTVTRAYTVEAVPWVMFFHEDQGLHGVYWHDGFGAVRSHGCVNLPPRAAHRLFDWSPPELPPGWEAVIPVTPAQGLRVRVR